MAVLVEPFASVYDDRSRLGIILVAREGRLRGLRRRQSQLGTVSEPAQSRCRDHHDAPVGRPHDRRWQAGTEPTNGGGVDHGKADDKAERGGPRNFVLRRDRH